MGGRVRAADHWREQLASWAVPEDILAAAPESPYGFATECFRRRGAAVPDAEPTPTTRRALEVLPEGGAVLDVGVGGGGTSIPLAARAGLIVGVDAQPDMLEGFLTNAAAAGVAARAVADAWPDATADVEIADVVLAGHVFYNTSDLEPFVRALHDHARYRVVVELTGNHPLDWMRDLWLRFHGLERPVGPTADDAASVLADLGFAVGRDERVVAGRHGSGGFARREDAIHSVRKRLCIPADRDEDIASALEDRLRQLDDLWDVGPSERTVVTLWWDHA
jgi:SAM-dependent methyltransferase